VKIFEITERDKTWSAISGVETEFELESEVKLTYATIVELLELLIQLRSKYRVAAAMPTITAFEDKLVKFVNYPFLDEDDADLEDRKNRANTMLLEIASLKQQLPK